MKPLTKAADAAMTQQLPTVHKCDEQESRHENKTLVASDSLSAVMAALTAVGQSAVVRKYAIQGVFLFTGVFSTCAAQYVFYQGAGGMLLICYALPSAYAHSLFIVIDATRCVQTRKRCCCRCATTWVL